MQPVIRPAAPSLHCDSEGGRGRFDHYQKDDDSIASDAAQEDGLVCVAAPGKGPIRHGASPLEKKVTLSWPSARRKRRKVSKTGASSTGETCGSNDGGWHSNACKPVASSLGQGVET